MRRATIWPLAATHIIPINTTIMRSSLHYNATTLNNMACIAIKEVITTATIAIAPMAPPTIHNTAIVSITNGWVNTKGCALPATTSSLPTISSTCINPSNV